jgi:cyanophycinase
LVVLLSVVPCSAAKRYTYSRVGSPTDATTVVSGGTVLMGGGLDVDAAFTWMCSRAGNGDFLVLRATGTDAYNPYIQGLCPNANSVATLIVPGTSGANDAFVTTAIQNAEAIFLAGGDQSDYVTYWKGTALQSALNDAIARGVVVGGTSAGMMVLTQFVYSALASQGATSSQSLADPFNKYISLDRDFAAVTLLQNALGDTHFVTRDRMGRTLAFLARVADAQWSPAPRGIAIDERTAVLVQPGGTATIVGSSYAYFLAAPGAAEVCQAKTALTYRNVAVQKVGATGTFNFSRWTATGGTTYAVTAEAGVLSSTQSGGAIY